MLSLVFRHVFGGRKISNNLMIMFHETAKIDLMTNVGLRTDLFVKLAHKSLQHHR